MGEHLLLKMERFCNFCVNLINYCEIKAKSAILVQNFRLSYVRN